MRISTKGHYGMHAMINLGTRYGQGAVLLRSICEAHSFSEKYVEQLLRSLRHAGLVESMRGAKGGYWLTRSPDEITVLEIIEALEGDLHQYPSMCSDGCAEMKSCAMLEIWREATADMRKVLADKTLGDMLRRQTELDVGKGRLEYNI